MSPVLLAGAALMIAAAAVVRRAGSAADARRLAVSVTAAATVAAVGWRVVAPDALTTTLILAVTATGLVACALADLVEHDRDSLAMMVGATGATCAALACDDMPWVSLLCCAVALEWGLREARRAGAPGAARVMALYGRVSLILAAGALAATTFSFGVSPSVAAVTAVAALVLRTASFPAQTWLSCTATGVPAGVSVVTWAGAAGLLPLTALVPEGPARLVQTVAVCGAVVLAATACAAGDPRRVGALLASVQGGLTVASQSSGSIGATWLASSVAAGSLMMLIAAHRARGGSLEAGALAGDPGTPRLAAATMVAGLCCAGMPLSLGFVVEETLADVAVEHAPWLVVVLAAASAAAAVAVVRLYLSLFAGRPSPQHRADLCPREATALGVVFSVLLVGGIAPTLMADRPGAHRGPAHHGAPPAAGPSAAADHSPGPPCSWGRMSTTLDA